MLQPKRPRRRKVMRGNVQTHASRGNTVSFGDFGLQAIKPGFITDRQLEAGRIAISHFLHGEGKYWIRVFPQKPITSKPLEVRMGSGKGDLDFWAAVVRPGTIIYEIGGVSEETAKAALNRAAHKMPVTCRMTKRRPQI